MRATDECVHSRMPPEFVLPDFVKLYLNKGSKYIMDRHKCSIGEVTKSLDKLEVKMHTAKHFELKPLAARQGASKLRACSGWKPPKDEQVARFHRLLRQTVLDEFVAKPIRRNYNWLDCKARQWLKQRKNELVIVDCDKGLGDAIIPRAWVENETKRLLSSGFAKLDPDDYKDRSFEARCALECVTRHAESVGVVTRKTAQFILQRIFTDGEGSFRLRVKLHKHPMTGRPIANLSHSWVAPACLFLREALQPIQKVLRHVVSSSSEFLQKMSKHVPAHYEIATVDIKNLYPSIDTNHLLEVLCHDVRRFYGGSQKAVFITGLLQLVLRNQFILHRGEAYQAFGIATGIPPGVFLANIYVSHVDNLVLENHSSHIAFYARLVDDSVVCASDIDSIQRTQNSWRPELVWEVASRGGRLHEAEQAVPFLDVQLSHCNGVMHWEAYRKPLNKYLYVPQASCHPKSISASIIRGETHRMWRINKSKSDLMKHLSFFAMKFSQRGYSLTDAWKSIRETLAKLHEGSKSKMKKKQFFTVLRYSSSVPKHVLKKCFDKHADSLKRIFSEEVAINLAFSVQKNLFRLHFPDNWTQLLHTDGWREGSVFLNSIQNTNHFRQSTRHCLFAGFLPQEPRVEQDLSGRNRYSEGEIGRGVEEVHQQASKTSIPFIAALW